MSTNISVLFTALRISLAVYNLSPDTVLSFVQAYSNFGDVIRHTMGKCREIHNKAFARVLLLSLQQEFEKLMDESEGNVDSSSKEFAAIKVC